MPTALARLVERGNRLLLPIQSEVVDCLLVRIQEGGDGFF
jgi:hypothetical protein